jgi:RNA polymerase sigma-70 factor, ECF subfamily
MVTSAFPLTMLDTNCVSAFDADPPQARFPRRQSDAVTRALAGDAHAFTEIYLLHKKRVLNICTRMVHDLSQAEDLAQETFVQLHRKLGSFRGRVLPVVSIDEMMTNVLEEHTGREFGARDLVQAGVVDRLDLKRAVDALAPGYRCVYILHDVEGFAHWEIAEMQKCSVGNSKSQLYKARRALRSALLTQRVPASASAMIH